MESSALTYCLSFDLNRPIKTCTNIKEARALHVWAELAEILIGWSRAKRKRYVNTENADFGILYMSESYMKNYTKYDSVKK